MNIEKLKIYKIFRGPKSLRNKYITINDSIENLYGLNDPISFDNFFPDLWNIPAIENYISHFPMPPSNGKVYSGSVNGYETLVHELWLKS